MALNFLKRKNRKACIIGLDGVPFTLIKSMTASGVMPRTHEIIARGHIKSMTVTLPEISSVSWSTFMTGKNPGEHGIFGFTDIKEGTYDLRFPSFLDLKTPTIWDRLGERGMKSIVINQPSTYPARSIPGVLISGFVAIDLKKSVTPPSLFSTLNATGYQVDIDTHECAGDPGKLFTSLNDLLDKRRQIMELLWEDQKWNLMEVVVTGTDRLHHFMWDAIESEEHPQHEDFLDYYRKVDEFIGIMFDKYLKEDAGDNFFILSDHGFCGTVKEVYINSILHCEGFLKIPDGSNSLDAVDEVTRAFSLDPARVYINRKGRFPKGGVSEIDAESIRKNLEDVFRDFTMEGQKVIRHIFRGEEVYSGPYADKGPDLLLVPEDGFDLKGRVGSKEFSGTPRLKGMHTWDNAFFFALGSEVLEENEELNIIDIPSKILRSIGVEI